MSFPKSEERPHRHALLDGAADGAESRGPVGGGKRELLGDAILANDGVPLFDLLLHLPKGHAALDLNKGSSTRLVPRRSEANSGAPGSGPGDGGAWRGAFDASERRPAGFSASLSNNRSVSKAGDRKGVKGGTEVVYGPAGDVEEVADVEGVVGGAGGLGALPRAEDADGLEEARVSGLVHLLLTSQTMLP